MSGGRPAKGAKAAAAEDPAAAFAAGILLLKRNPALAAVPFSICAGQECAHRPADGWAVVSSTGTVHVNRSRRAEPEEWAWVLAHCALHLGFGHLPAARGLRVQPDRCEEAARCTVVNRFLATFSVGRPPIDLPALHPGDDEEQLAARWRRDGVPADHAAAGVAGGRSDQLLEPWARFDPPGGLDRRLRPRADPHHVRRHGRGRRPARGADR